MASSAWDPRTGIPSLGGKVAFVTGGNAGIGYATVEQLAVHGAKVYMACRSEAKATAAIQKLHEDNPSLGPDSVLWHSLDLTEVSGVKRSAKSFLEKESRLDILVNNAGMIAEDYQTTVDGFELCMAINHVGHFVLVDVLLPLLKATAASGADVRIVTVSSVAHKMFIPSDLKFSAPEDLNVPGAAPGSTSSLFAKFRRYSRSKLANILFAAELQRRLDEEQVRIVSVATHPGAAATDGAFSLFSPYVLPIMRLLYPTAQQAATSSLFAATASTIADSHTLYIGKYIAPKGKIETPSAAAQNAELARDLWATTEKVVAAIEA